MAIEAASSLVERMLSAQPLPDWREALRQSFDDLDLAWPGGESGHAAMRRGRAAIDELLVRLSRRWPPSPTAI